MQELSPEVRDFLWVSLIVLALSAFFFFISGQPLERGGFLTLWCVVTLVIDVVGYVMYEIAVNS